MRSISRISVWATTLATAVGATVVFASGPAAAADGYWADGCDPGRACVWTNHGDWGRGNAWNFIGCGMHGLSYWFNAGQAHGNKFRVTYQDGRWDETPAWTSRALDDTNLAKSAWVYC